MAAIKMSYNGQQGAFKRAQGNLEKIKEKIEVNCRDLEKSGEGVQGAGVRLEKARQEEKRLGMVSAVSKYLFFYK